jgi:TolB protein
MKSLATLAFFLLAGCATGNGRENMAVFDRYIAALDRHDVEGQFAEYGPDMHSFDEGRRGTPDKERSRANREFEAANNARWSYRLLGHGPGTLDLVITEGMDYYDLLGVGPRSHRARYHFRDGKIVKVEAWDWTQRGRPYYGARDSFARWAARERPEAAAEVMGDGRLIFTRETAARINDLVREWRAAVSCRIYHPSPNAASTHIVFSSDCAPPWGIYVVNADGTMPRRVTPEDMEARLPNWSPDGKKIVFQSNREGSWDLYVVDVDGTNLVRLTHGPAAESSPAFSPDGTRILFASDIDGTNDLFLIPSSGGEPARLTRGEAAGFRSAWSPDGSHVLYRTSGTSEMSAPGEFRRVRADGRAAGAIAGGKRHEYNQAYSPDGSRIAFDAHRDGGWESDDGKWEIWLMNADGSGRRAITANEVNDWGPAWFGDGKRIVFLSGVNNIYDIYTMNADGSNVRRLTYWTGLNERR